MPLKEKNRFYSFDLCHNLILAFTLIVIGSWDIIEAVIFYNPLFDASITSNNELLFKLISAIDLFLIGIVLLIFGFGIYELFVSEIDFANAKFSEISEASQSPTR